MKKRQFCDFQVISMGKIDLFWCCYMVQETPFSIFCDPCNIFYVWDGFNTLAIGSEAMEWGESERSKILIFTPFQL